MRKVSVLALCLALGGATLAAAKSTDEVRWVGDVAARFMRAASGSFRTAEATAPVTPPHSRALAVEAGQQPQAAPGGDATAVSSPAIGKAHGDDGKSRLVQAIQTELQRVGCYSGAIDGRWDGDTRRAMKSFNERITATLPIAQPDYILLTLLQGHRSKACGAPCALGEAQNAAGRCQPTSTLVEAKRNEAVPQAQTQAQSPAWARTIAESASATASGRTPSASAGQLIPPAPVPAVRPSAAGGSERAQIAAAEERKRRAAAAQTAAQEAERQAQLAEAEKARLAAEQRRREARAALAARLAAANPTGESQRSGLGLSGVLSSAPPASTPAGATPVLVAAPTLAVRPGQQPGPVQPPPAAAAALPPQPSHPAAQPSEPPRFVAQFTPPPYHVGRPPTPPGVTHSVPPERRHRAASAPSPSPRPAPVAVRSRLAPANTVLRTISQQAP